MKISWVYFYIQSLKKRKMVEPLKIGRVYKIVTDLSDDVYVGSTFLTVEERFQTHKYDYTAWKKGKYRQNIKSFDMFDRYSVDHCKVFLLNEYNVVDRRHLEVYETLWIHKLKALNGTQPVGGLLVRYYMKHYRKDNKDHIKESKKKYREDNKDHIREMKNKYAQEHTEQIKERTKTYYESSKDKILERNKNYYESNKDRIYKQRSQKVECNVCQEFVSKQHLSRHNTSKKHQNNIGYSK